MWAELQTHPGQESGKILLTEVVMWRTRASKSSTCVTEKDRVCLSVSKTTCKIVDLRFSSASPIRPQYTPEV